MALDSREMVLHEHHSAIRRVDLADLLLQKQHGIDR
jgi:hypothetical protein